MEIQLDHPVASMMTFRTMTSLMGGNPDRVVVKWRTSRRDYRVQSGEVDDYQMTPMAFVVTLNTLVVRRTPLPARFEY